MRAAVLAALAAGAMASGKIVTPDVHVELAAGCTPTMRWVNYGDVPTDMVISWTTSCAAEPIVAFGTTPSLGSSVAGPAPTTYSFVTYTSPFIYHVVLHNLTLNTKYYYQVGGPTSGLSAVQSFQSHPGVGQNVPELSFALIGDLGQTSNSNDTVNHISQNSAINAVIHVGDLSYADDYEPRWDSWQTLVDPLSSHLPWMTLVGNHEVESFPGVSSTFLAYKTRWRMPYAAGQPQLYYSFNIGPVHWIMASSYSDFDAGSDQYNWIKADLAAVNRSATPWVLFGTHAPWYNSNKAHQGEGEAMRQAIEPLLYGNVDACFFGHVHAYERNNRVNNFKADPNGPYHITIGDGGNREGLASSWNAQPSYSAFRQAVYGHGELVVVNSTHIYWTFHANPNMEPIVTDSLWIVKGQ